MYGFLERSGKNMFERYFSIDDVVDKGIDEPEFEAIVATMDSCFKDA